MPAWVEGRHALGVEAIVGDIAASAARNAYLLEDARRLLEDQDSGSRTRFGAGNCGVKSGCPTADNNQIPGFAHIFDSSWWFNCSATPTGCYSAAKTSAQLTVGFGTSQPGAGEISIRRSTKRSPSRNALGAISWVFTQQNLKITDNYIEAALRRSAGSITQNYTSKTRGFREIYSGLFGKF